MLSKILPNNENSIDRAVRIVLGLGLLAIVFVGPHSRGCSASACLRSRAGCTGPG